MTQQQITAKEGAGVSLATVTSRTPHTTLSPLLHSLPPSLQTTPPHTHTHTASMVSDTHCVYGIRRYTHTLRLWYQTLQTHTASMVSDVTNTHTASMVVAH